MTAGTTGGRAPAATVSATAAVATETATGNETAVTAATVSETAIGTAATATAIGTGTVAANAEGMILARRAGKTYLSPKWACYVAVSSAISCSSIVTFVTHCVASCSSSSRGGMGSAATNANLLPIGKER